MKIVLLGLVASLTLVNRGKEKENRNVALKNEVKMATAGMDKQKIQELLTTFYDAVDHRSWDVVADKMNHTVYVDYTELGGDSGYKSPNEILAGWKAMLPGFERTIHHIHNEAIWVANSRASATLDAIAVHYLDGDYWSVFVGYDTEFVRVNGEWKIARIDLSLYDQAGNQSLPSIALDNVNQGRVPPLMEAKNVEAIESFFESLEERDLDGVLSNLSDQVVQEMPFAPKNFPRTLTGIDAMRQQYSGVMEYTQKYYREYFGTMDPNVILVKFRGTITTGEGKPYNNSYMGIFKLSGDGKITNFNEQFNPKILLSGWPGLQPESYSVHKAGAPTNGGVSLQDVTFRNQGVSLKGHLFLPPNFDASKKYPSVVVTGSWTSVKEQMPDEYASLLAEAGLIALTFDFTGFGESEGLPRQVEDYNLKIDDIKSAVNFLSSHENVDGDAIIGLGVCASAGYMAHATAQDLRIKKLVLVAPWLHNPEIASSIYDARPGGTAALIESAKRAKYKFAETGEMDYILAASELDPLSAMYVPENIFDYYLNPAKAAGPYYDNRFAVSSWEPWLTFDGISVGAKIKQPVFMVHSESGAVPQGAKMFYDLIPGEKDVVWLNDYNQQQMYFEEPAVSAVIQKVIDYLKH